MLESSYAVLSEIDAGEISEEQLQAAKLFFDEYGFVVLDRVLTPEQCAVSVAELWYVASLYSAMCSYTSIVSRTRSSL